MTRRNPAARSVSTTWAWVARPLAWSGNATMIRSPAGSESTPSTAPDTVSRRIRRLQRGQCVCPTRAHSSRR